MATTVNQAFREFLTNTVNLDNDETKTARSSRDWLVDQISRFPESIDNFPRLYEERTIFFGSFARRTKIRPLDDIDIMICLSAEGSTYYEGSETIEINVSDNADKLLSLCNNGSNILNSIKVVNKFVSSLRTVPQYKKAATKRNQEAAVLQLSSYDWAFDVVPCFYTKPDIFGRCYYLIPDGSGGWKKTDPRIDQERVTTINQQHDGNVLNVIRILKYWNNRPTMPSMSSYLIEVMILNYYETKGSKASKYVDLEIPDVLEHIWANILHNINDPKGIQGNINHLTYEERKKISTRAWQDKNMAEKARRHESDGDHRRSIEKWSEVFGTAFPAYG